MNLVNTVTYLDSLGVREDRGRYAIPDLLSDDTYEPDPATYIAAEDHAKHLRKVEQQLDEALDLIGLILDALSDVSDRRGAQIATGLKFANSRIDKARNRIDKHDIRHNRLFHAYVSLKGEIDAKD